MTLHIVDATIPFLTPMLWVIATFVLITAWIAIHEGVTRRRARDSRLKIAAVSMLLAMVCSVVCAVVAFIDFLFL